MNRLISFFIFILLSLFFLVLQTTLLSPAELGFFSPDLNLILIVFLALFFEIKVGAIIALGSAYMMDVLSGYLFGVHTLSRFAVYSMLKGFSENLYAESKLTQAFALFFSTVFSWLFIWVVLKMKTDVVFGFTPGLVMTQGVVNTLLGLLIFWIIKSSYERIQA